MKAKEMSSLPEFGEPPLVEVALSVQFDRLDSLQIPQLGLAWQTFRDRFPRTEEQPPIEPTFERFGPRPGSQRGLRLELQSVPPTPRLWFLNEDGSELVQVQRDRFVRNWRKNEETDRYPRYDRLREAFESDFNAFCDMALNQGWGTVVPSQCEVTYVNLIAAGDLWASHGELGKVVTVISADYPDKPLGMPEEIAINMKYILTDADDKPVGRLHVNATPVFRAADNQPAIHLALTARGIPDGEGTDGVLRFMDLGHKAIVQGFTSLTTREMHKVWKRLS